jgi:organic radical activating enzyme
MYQIPTKVDFYITNVCNYTCDTCNRFNNYDFKGWQSWAEYQDIYTEWANLVTLKSATIMGGEPLLNPTIIDWVSGINRLFGIEVQILTNGTRFKETRNLYDAMLWISKKNLCQNHLAVSLHNWEDWPQMREDIHNFLKGPIKELGKNENNWGSDFYFRDKNGVMINVYQSNNFGEAAIRPSEQGRLTLHNSDPLQAHNNCSFARWKSYHFIKGRLYKCGPVALMPEFDRQFNLDITDTDRQLLNSYQSLGVDNYAEYHEQFFATLDNPIPQCKFCPADPATKIIYPTRKRL